MSARYVMHDGYRWRVKMIRVCARARARDCEADQHEATRVIRNEDGVLRFNVKRGIFTLRLPRKRTGFSFTMRGLIQMAARAEAARKAAEKAHKRRMRGRS